MNLRSGTHITKQEKKFKPLLNYGLGKQLRETWKAAIEECFTDISEDTRDTAPADLEHKQQPRSNHPEKYSCPNIIESPLNSFTSLIHSL